MSWDVAAVSCKPQLTDSHTNFLFLNVTSSRCVPFSSADLKVLGPDVFKGTANFSTFLLNHSSGMLYLGARDAILSVDTNRLGQKPQMVGQINVKVVITLDVIRMLWTEQFAV